MNEAEADYRSSPKAKSRAFKEPRVLIPALAGGLLVLIAAMGLINNSAVPPGRDPAGPAARLAVAKARRERAGSVAFGVLGGALLLAGLGVPLGGLATSEQVSIVVVGAAVAWFARRSAKRLDWPVAGYQLAEADYQHAVHERLTQAESAHRARYADLASIGAEIPPFDPTSVCVSEPHLTTEEAVALAKNQAVTGGFSAPEGSALAAVADESGGPSIANARLHKVCKDFRWVTYTNNQVTGEPVPSYWLDVVRIEPLGEGDARIVIAAAHASVGEEELTKKLAALLKAWKVRAAMPPIVQRDHSSGLLHVTVTNNSAAASQDDEDGAVVWK
ncbi:hypothetical protein [Tsukamurella paurometabola]|uniref:Uncharacterized protein n=1 Tax=Tsukamurella paurometabola TaxID=2061 RepID=A0A3P8K6K9_TSUPA|nr:hypothetical protein [Tsukamurella paurometabola]UEA83309.1 hypothetical protein LK411_00150 [Tsukamurella paurometabola]VDR40414.1 Uncharacterised protein [Tsukamurella paurometabola]